MAETPLEELHRLLAKRGLRFYWEKFVLAISEWRHGYRPWRSDG